MRPLLHTCCSKMMKHPTCCRSSSSSSSSRKKAGHQLLLSWSVLLLTAQMVPTRSPGSGAGALSSTAEAEQRQLLIQWTPSSRVAMLMLRQQQHRLQMTSIMRVMVTWRLNRSLLLLLLLFSTA
jgi:hypothetical protein